MTDLLPWNEYTRWHDIFDALCVERGHYDNARLAADFCALAGTQGQTAYDAAFKSLGNWRRGIHTPHRRNFGILTKLLDIDRYDGLRPHWNRLYRSAKERGDDATELAVRADSVPADLTAGATSLVATGRAAFASDRPTWRLFMLAGAAAALSLASYVAWSEFLADEPAPTEITVEYRPAVKLMIGESVVIHGMRAPKCGDPAPDWEAVLRRFPLQLQTGRLSDGGVGVRSSASCALPTPVRVVTFTANRPGVEEINMFGDPIRIEVLLRPASARFVDENSEPPGE